MMRSLLGDLRFALRTLSRSRGFAAAAIVTLALGIGANTAIFSVVDAVLLRPLPYPGADRLVWGWGRFPGGIFAAISPPDFIDYRDRNTVFERVAAMGGHSTQLNLGGAGADPEQVTGALVTAGFFETFGIAPALGRVFSRQDEDVAFPESVVLSHGLWTRRFGADPTLVGKTILLDGRTSLVAGVMPASFSFPSEADLWQPVPMRNPEMQVRRFHQLRLIGLLRPGVSIDQARAGLDAVALDLEHRYPESNRGWGIRLESLHERIVDGSRPALLVLLASVALVLLIACANLANLLFARSAGRRKEIAIRAALGAGRARLVRQLLTENLLLALLGGGLGLVVALWGIDTLRALGPAGVPRLAETSLNVRVLAATALVSILTGLLFGFAPAIRATSGALQERLNEGGRSSGGSAAGGRWRGALIVAEVSLSVMLLVGAGLLIRSLTRLMQVDPGFRTDHLVTTRLHLPLGRYEEGTARARFYGALFEKLEAAPGVEAAGGTTELPLTGQHNDIYFTIEGRPAPPEGHLGANFHVVTPGYFRTMGIPLRAGRTFDARDAAGKPGAVVINEPMARAFFPDGSPIGQRLVIDLGEPFRAEIVGVVAGVRHWSLTVPAPAEMFVVYDQAPAGMGLNLVVRTLHRPEAIVPTLRQVLREIDPAQPLGAVRTLDDVVASSIARPRFRALLLALFAGAALLLAAIGIYGLVSWMVAQRTQEIGVRMALGAGRRDILALMIGRGMRLTAAGIVLGIAGAFAASRLLTGLLFGVAPADPATFAGVPLVLAATALVACYVPARRATKVDPMIALRYE